MHNTVTVRVGSTLDAHFMLRVLDGEPTPRTLALTAGEHIIGTGEGCGLVLGDRFASRQHARITVACGRILLQDLGSKNGTYVAGARVGEAMLHEGALFRIGSTTLQLLRVADEEACAEEPRRVGRLIGRSPAMERVFAMIDQVARTDISVLIEGETGSGKELCAEAIHQQSARAKGPFVVCDLAGIHGSLLESELFGHVRGAFSGATSDRIGLVTRAHGGTLFLDEIGELDPDLQTRLLRILQERQVKPVGATTFRRCDIRVIAATNRDLRGMVRAGRFREDLYYRLAVVRVAMPPLRERSEDIPLLVRQLLDGRAIDLPLETLMRLAEHPWPGNVRELHNTIARAVSLMKPGARELSPFLLDLNGSSSIACEEEAAVGGADTFARARDRVLATWERNYLTSLMERTDANLSRASRESGIERTYLRRLLKRYGIRRAQAAGDEARQ